MKNKLMVSRIIKVVCFMIIVIISLISSSYILEPRDNTVESGIINPNANGFMSEPKDTIEIAVIGNSNAYSGFSPMELWNKYGYTSYVGAESHQNVAKAYAMLNKILKYQSPRLVILETDEIFEYGSIPFSVAYIINTFFNFPFSVFRYHNCWKNIKHQEIFKKPKYTEHFITKGQMLSNETNPYTGGEYMKKSNKFSKIPFATKMALDTFVSKCRKNKIELFLVELPSKAWWNINCHNSVKKYAEENKLNFIDLNLNRDKFNFNWEKDTKDAGNHLNNRGARKTTLFIGKYLKENYKLRDRRNDPRYKQWGKDYEIYKKRVVI